MNNDKNPFNITKSILVFCIILITFILVSCSKPTVNDNVESITLNSLNEKHIESNSYASSQKYDKNASTIERKESSTYNKENLINEFKNEDLSNIKNTYYGKYNLHGEDILGNFEVSRNSIVFTPDNGHSREVIHFNGLKSVDRFDHPNGQIDLSLQFEGYEKVIKNVNESMFSDILLYTTK